MDFTILIYSGLIALGLLGVGSRFIPGWKPDNKIEEVCEKIIEYKSNVKIDLSPDTPDPDDDTAKKNLSASDQVGPDQPVLVRSKKKRMTQKRSFNKKAVEK